MSRNIERERVHTLLEASYNAYYEEQPVSMWRFLTDNDFLGISTKQSKMVYPIWIDILEDLMDNPEKNLPIFTGAIGTGKTSAAIWGVAYVMHVVLCLKDPWTYFHKTSAGKMSIVFFNLTKSLGTSKGFNLLQSYLLKSPWFCQRGRHVGSTQNPRLEFPIFEYVSGSPYAKGFGVQGHDIIAALMDEVDSPSESMNQRIRVLKAFEAGYRRFENRFVFSSQVADKRLSIGKFFLVASKQEQLSFLNVFITKMKNSRNVYIVDIPIWEAKEAAEYKGPKFPVMIGDLYTPSKVLGRDLKSGFETSQKAIDSAIKTGFKVISVPIEYLDAFQLDIVGALRDYAGISIAGMRKSKLFPSEKLLVDCYDPAKRDPIKKLTIEVGLTDEVNFTEYIDFRAIRIPKHIPRYIHVDIAYSGNGDALGLGMSCISGWTDRTVEKLDGSGEMKVEKLPVVETDFGMRIHARAGDKIPLSKVRKLIVDLKRIHGYNIQLVTFDLNLLSEDTKQLLGRVGVNCDSLSLDKNPQIYRGFRDLVHDKRWCCHRNEYLHFELSNLEDDPVKNRVDHPEEVVDIKILEDGNTVDIVVKGSKDECFTKDVKIALLDGRSLSIPEIEDELKKGKELYVYSVDVINKKVVAGKIANAFQTGEVNKLVEVTLDNGRKIICTPNHPFMNRLGNYILASDLKEGDSLLPLYTREWKGYRLVKNPFSGKNHFEHRLFSGFLDKHLSCNKYLVHHKWDEEKGTFDKSNNSPPMLQIMARFEHTQLHGSHPSSSEKMKKMQERAQEVMATHEWKEKQADVARKSTKTRVERGTGSCFATSLRRRGIDPMDDPNFKKCQEAATNARRGVPSWCSGLTKETDERIKVLAKNVSKTKCKKNALLKQKKVDCFVCSTCDKTFENTNECFVKNHTAACERNSKLLHDVVCKYCEKEFLSISFGKFLSHIGNCAKRVKKSLNHKVVKVKFVSRKEKVYDLTIENYHNFALAAGVFVHNSDGVVGSVENALRNAGDSVPKEFADSVKRSIPQPKKVDTLHSLLNIQGESDSLYTKDIIDVVSKEDGTKFKDVFGKSQRKL